LAPNRRAAGVDRESDTAYKKSYEIYTSAMRRTFIVERSLKSARVFQKSCVSFDGPHLYYSQSCKRRT